MSVEQLWAANGGPLSRKHRGPYTYRATVPSRIASAELSLDSETTRRIESAAVAARAYNERGGVEPAAIVAPLLRTESVASSRIEKLDVGHRRLAEALAGVGQGKGAAREVAGNVRALETALALADDPNTLIGTSLVVAVHRALLAETDPEIAGRLRAERSWIGGQSPGYALYVPPPPELVVGLLDDLDRFLERDDLPAIAKAAIAHAQFEGIHPFADGNGRTGRTLVQVIYRREGLAPRYAVPVSTILLADKDGYFADLASYQVDGDPRPIVRRFADATRDGSDRAAGLVDALAAVRREWLDAIGTLRSDSLARVVLDDLPRHPVVDVATVAERHEVVPRVALRAIDRLASAGILREATGGRRDRSWIAHAVISELDDFAAGARRR